MSTFNIHKNKAICVLPWIHQHLDLSGRERPCCISKPILSHRSIDMIREEMLSGKKPLECIKCYNDELQNQSSSRIRETIDWIKKFGEPNIEHPLIQYLDVRNDPTCNLKCKTCGPTESTLWAKEKNLPIKLPNYDLSKYNKNQLKKVYLAGGEPTYNKEYIKFLKELAEVNPTCEVVINTNLKRLPTEWKSIISSFQNLSVIISCDAIHDLGCYVRYPLEWSQFEENVKFVRDNANFTMFNLVASNLTVHSIDKTIKWMNQYSNHISLTVVYGDIWQHSAVPLKFREVYVQSLEKIVNFPISNWSSHKFRLNCKSLIEKYRSKEYDINLHKKLQQEITEQDSHRKSKLKTVDSFLDSWIYERI